MDLDYLLGFFKSWMEETTDAQEYALIVEILSGLLREKLAA